MPDDMIAARFETVALAQPDSPAFGGSEKPVTYGTCLDTVHELADSLSSSVAPGHCVAIDLPKSPAAVLAMLACLTAGVAYVPIDHAAPALRRQQILRDCEPWLLLTDPDIAASCYGLDAPRMSRQWLVQGVDQGSCQLLSLRRRTNRDVLLDRGIACVLYTSGSTGHPKGVLISRANIDYFVGWAARAFPLSPEDQVAQHAPLHFDLPVYDLFVGLTSGACLHLVDRATAMLPSATHRLLAERSVTVIYAVPSAFNALMRAPGMSVGGGLPSLRRIMYAGESFHVPQLGRFRAALPRSIRIFNLYGPIETNVITWHEIQEPDLSRDEIPIGLPASGTDVRLWHDQRLLELRPGAEGEIAVAGPAVSPGYLNDALSSVYLPDENPPVRSFYRTGDHAQVDPRGRLLFRGRHDDMVKVRGHRVELGEVEATLTAHPDVAEALVRVCGSGDGTTLHASVVLATGSTATGPLLRQWLMRRLPSYMVPRAVEVAPGLPVTSTGKLARRPAMEMTP